MMSLNLVWDLMKCCDYNPDNRIKTLLLTCKRAGNLYNYNILVIVDNIIYLSITKNDMK